MQQETVIVLCIIYLSVCLPISSIQNLTIMKDSKKVRKGNKLIYLSRKLHRTYNQKFILQQNSYTHCHYILCLSVTHFVAL